MANDGRILIHASVIAVKDDQILYPCCKQCYSKLQHEEYEKEWICFKCSIVYEESKLEWRFRLSITVAEKASVTDIALFGKTLEPYFGTSAERFHRFLGKIDEDNLLEENMLLSALEETFVGQSFIFGIKSNARLKELQKYHGPTSPVCGSTVLKVRLGDYATQSSFNSDLVAVQILSSANVSFTGNTVLHNLQTLTDLKWDSKPLCFVVNTGCKSIQECSYLPYTTFDQSENYSYFKDSTTSGIELSYEQSSYQTNFNESHLQNDVNLQTKSRPKESMETTCDITIDKSGHVTDVLVDDLELSLETPKQQKIKNENNQVSRPKLSKKLCLSVDPCLKTVDENNVSGNSVIKQTQQNKDFKIRLPEQNIQKHSLVRYNSGSNSAQNISQGQITDNCFKFAHSGNFMPTTKCDITSQDIQCGSKLQDSFYRHSTTIEPENSGMIRSSDASKLTSMPNNHDESSLEVLRNYDQDIKAHYDPSYLSYSDWDNSFNFTGLNSNIESVGQKSQKTQKNSSQVTVIDMPESENLDQFLNDASFLSVDCPESLQFGTTLKAPSNFKPKTFNKSSSKLSDTTALLPSSKKSYLALNPLNAVNGFRFAQCVEEIPENVCEMPASEDLSKFLDNDSFDAQIMTEDFVDFETQQRCDKPILDPKCDHSRTFLPCLKIPYCDINKSDNTHIEKQCDNFTNLEAELKDFDNPQSHDAQLKVTKCNISADKQTENDSSKDQTAVLNSPFQSDTMGSDSQNINYDHSTCLSFEACLKEIENCELTSHYFVSSQILLDSESMKTEQPICIVRSAVNSSSVWENSNGSNGQNLNVSAVCGNGRTGHGNFGDDSQRSMCLFSDEEDGQSSFNSQDFRPKTQDNVNCSNLDTSYVGKDNQNPHAQDYSYNDAPSTRCVLQIKDSNINVQSLEDSGANASTILDLEVMRNSSAHFNHDILTESLFGDSISCSKNDISELLLGMDLKDVEVERHSYQNVIHKEDTTVEWGTELENDDFLALDLCKASNLNQNKTCDSVLNMPEKKSEEVILNQTISIKIKELPVITKANLDLEFDSVDDSQILAMDCSQKQFLGAPISPSIFDMLPEEGKDLQQKENTMNNSPFSHSKAARNGGVLSKGGETGDGKDFPETLNTSKPENVATDLISHAVHENDMQQNRTDVDNDLNYSSQFLDVTEDGSMDLFDCSRSFAASQSGVKSQSKSMLTVDNSVMDTSGPVLNPVHNLCSSKRVNFARRLSTVRHLNLVDIRLNMCKTSSPLTSANNLKSCLRKSVQGVPSGLHEFVCSQNMFSPSPVKSTRDLKLSKEPGINCYNSTPVNSNPSQVSAVFSPDLFSPG